MGSSRDSPKGGGLPPPTDDRPRAPEGRGARSRCFAGLRVAWRIVRGLLIAYLVVLLLLMFLENKLVFIPSKYPEGDWRPYGLTPEDAWFESSDGVRLHGWYVAHERPLAHVLFCHGNAGNVTHRDDVLRQLHDLVGASVLVFDYRGYGRSSGSPNEKGILADARAARTWLAQRAGIAEERVVLMGESLGGAVAVHLAAERAARGLVLENTFTTLPDVAAAHYPWVPVRLLMRTRLDSLEKIRGYRGPLFQSHGDRDTIVPYELGRRLFEAAEGPKQFYLLSGADHNDPHPRAYYEALRGFLEGLP